MNANLKKWTIGGLTAAAMILVAAGNEAFARRETNAPSNCGGCTAQIRSGQVVCELASCNNGCQYVCRIELPTEPS